MCEFCTQHGEGKKWYLQMQNYAEILLHEPLSESQKNIVAAPTRLEWNQRFFRDFVLPAVTGKKSIEEWEGTRERPKNETEAVHQRQVEHYGQVIPIEDVDRVIDMVDSITRMPCGCRFLSTGKTDRRYCFGFGLDKWGILGKYPEASASLEVLGKQEARDIFHKFDAEGLIHTIWTGVTPYVVGLCNCDRDCEAYKGYIEMRGLPSFFRAEYVCQVDWDKCNGCKACMSQCQFGSQFYSHSLEKVYIDPRRCYGCGICRAACPEEAITLLPRQAVPQAAGVWL
jgi:NAD-dependent dihydropyrimidine dehydrogenase PreA subunit